jgi:hypothetical protein
MADGVELVRGKNVVAVIDFHRASIFPTDSSPGERPEHVVPTDPRGRFHKVNHHAGNPGGIYEADSTEYWEAITEAVAPAGSILLVGHGTGRANAAQHWLAYVEQHRRDVADKVVADIHVDIGALDHRQVLRLAQRYFAPTER